MDNYKINKNIDRESRIAGLTIDEFIPLLCSLIIGFVIKTLFIGVIAGLFFVLAIRHFKKGRRGHFLLNILYWYAPKIVIERHFSVTPASEDRFWIR